MPNGDKVAAAYARLKLIELRRGYGTMGAAL